MESFAELLSKYIKQAGITDTELSRAIGVSRQTIFRWREGLTSRPNSREDVLAISKKLRLSPEEQDLLLLSAGFRPDEALAVKSPGMPSSAELPAVFETLQQSHPEETEQSEISEMSRSGPKILKKSGKRFSRFFIISTSALLLVVVIVLVVTLNWSNWLSGKAPENPPVTSPVPSISGASPIAPAAPGETLILVAPFDESVSGSRAAGQLVNSIQRESKNNRLSNIRIQMQPAIIKDQAQAARLSLEQQASLIIYGENTAGQTRLYFSPALVQVQSSISISYNDTPVEDIQALSLIILGSLYLDRHAGEQAYTLLGNARNLLQYNATQNSSLLTLVNELLAEAGQTGV
jgi:transcriptional regulator with XRE-family HTH domain